MNQKSVSADERAKRKEHAATWITAYSPYAKAKTAHDHWPSFYHRADAGPDATTLPAKASSGRGKVFLT